MIIKEISTPEVSVFFLRDPKLCLMGLADGYLSYLAVHGEYPDVPEERVYGLYEKDDLVAVVMFEEHDKDTLTMHFYLSTHNLRKEIISQVYPIIENMLSKTYKHTKVIVQVPKSCEHIQKVVRAIGFKYKSTINGGITWRDTLQDLYSYETEINKENS